MERRFVLFIVLTMLVLTGHVLLQAWLAPPRPPPVAESEAPAVSEEDPSDATASTESDEVPAVDADPQATPAPRVAAHQRRVALGTFDGSEGPLLVTVNSLGGTIERIELVERTPEGRLRYRNLVDRSGYMGHVSPSWVPGQGSQINVVGRATPAATAVAAAGPQTASPQTGGLRVGDVITRLTETERRGQEVVAPQPADLAEFLSTTSPGETISVTVLRPDGQGQRRELVFEVTLAERPFQMLRPETLSAAAEVPHPLSFLFSLRQVGTFAAGPSQPELPSLRSARTEQWEVRPLAAPDQGVELRMAWDAADLEPLGVRGPLEVVKRYRLGAARESEDQRADDAGPSAAADAVLAYHLNFELEIRNLGDQPQSLSYRLQGPNGMPLEGWWYLNKIHTGFSSAGARDIVILTEADRKQRLFGCSAIYKAAAKKSQAVGAVLFAQGDPAPQRTIRYLGVDTQYFVGALLPENEATFERAEAVVLGDVSAIERGRQRTANTSFQLDSQLLQVPAGESVVHRFRFFAGPKHADLLADYGLESTIYYGWFGFVARPLSSVLHFFHRLVANYGLAIVMLTVVVRSLMFPISRRAAKNAAMMQELAPELRKITEKYKGDMERRARAQQELFRKHNYNPMGGCWLMFLQLPIFIGLYRCLAVDIELRQAPLIPGLDWCSNLAGPDMLFYWGDLQLLGLFQETGLLGPYFNILPLFTIALFLAQQKLFTPPATDDQTRMQLQMMKFMTVFIGVMFFKVASGLCLYFIASSLWGIAERKLLPRPKVHGSAASAAPAPEKAPAKTQRRSGSNGSPPRERGGKRRTKRR